MFPVEHIPRNTHHVTVQPNSLNEQGGSRHYVIYQRQISLIKAVISHITLKVRAPQLVKPKWGKNQTINREANKGSKVRARFIREHIHCYFPEQEKI
jgi:hypothetical protein